MRISDRYIGKQVLIGTVYAVVVLGIVLVLGSLFQQARLLLVEQKAPLGLVIRFAITVLPLSLIYTVPWGFLTAILLVFGRLSSNQEITSFRVAGMSLVRLSAPVFVIGAVLSILSLWLNIQVVPRATASSFELLFAQAARDPGSLLKPGIAQGDFEGDGKSLQQVLVEGRKGEWVTGFNFYQTSQTNDASPEQGSAAGTTFIHAQRAALSVNNEKTQLRIKLVNAYFETRDSNGHISNSSFAGEAEPMLINLRESKGKRKRKSRGAMTNDEILQTIAMNPAFTPEKKIQYRSEITRRYTFSMACLAFVFVGVPLGLNSRRKESSIGLIASLLIGAGYFMFSMLANEFKTDLVASIVLWIPNLICVALGLILFRRARFK
jgi:lipopolysaccharide export LptBFGC system permease protein LptF